MCKKEPKLSESEPKNLDRESDIADFVLEDLSRSTANLRVGDSRTTGLDPEWVDSTPFGCPMGRKWEIWLSCRVKPRKETLVRGGTVINFKK